ncbi:MAG: TldD/PmbA family protein [Brevinemataceae bacterium]
MKEQLIRAAFNSKADYSELNYTENKGSSVIISNGSVDQCINADSNAGSVRSFYKGGIGFCSFNHKNFEQGAEKALDSAIAGGDVQKFPAPSTVVKDTIENTMQEDIGQWTLEQKYEFTKKVHHLLEDSRFNSTRVEFRNSSKSKYYVDSAGSEIIQHKHFTGMSVSVSIKEGSTLQRAYFSDGSYGGIEILNGYEAKIEQIKQRAFDLLKAPKVEPGVYRVLLNPNLAGVFAHEAFGHMSEADFLAENPELLKKIALGTQIGIPELNITDDGRQEHLCGWCAYDDEGIPASRRELIKDGKVACYLQSRLTAHEMQMKPTGNGRALSPFYAPIPRMTNTYIENGTRSFESLIEELWDGIYACDMIGGMTNLEMFTFSAAYAYRVQKGKITGLIRDVVLSGNLFETMNNILGIGNDLQHHGGLGGCGKAGQNGLPVSTGSPHLLIDNVLIG